MDIMSYMCKQNKTKNQGRYRVEKLSAILSEVQAGNANQHTTI